MKPWNSVATEVAVAGNPSYPTLLSTTKKNYIPARKKKSGKKKKR